MLEDPSADINDSDLISFISNLRQMIPNADEGIVAGSLRSHGYRVTRARIRNAIHLADPLSEVLRWPGTLTHRRPYSVAGPNSLWHIGKTINLITSVYYVGGIFYL